MYMRSDGGVLRASETNRPKFSAKRIVFTKDIAPLLYKNCTSCHRSGQVAPFPLLTFEDARKHSKEIVALTQNRQMPPWKAKHGYVKFFGERRLLDEEIKLLKAWVDGGMEFGEEKDMPKPPTFADSWQLGTPDLVVTMPESVTIPPDGPDFFRVFVLPLDLPSDKYVRAMDIMPSNRKVLHHSTLLMDPYGAARHMAEQFQGNMPGFSAPGIYIGGWAPGGQVTPFPQGYALKFTKETDLIIESHFRPSGKLETEQTAVGLYFSDKSGLKEPGVALFYTNNIDLPPDQITHVKIDQVTDSNLTIFGIAGHAHLICSAMKVHAILPNKKDVPLLWIPDWDFNWQEQYRFEKPIFLPKGTRILADFTFDNTLMNFRNPNNPPIQVKFGPQSSDEMAKILFNTMPNRR